MSLGSYIELRLKTIRGKEKKLKKVKKTLDFNKKPLYIKV